MASMYPLQSCVECENEAAGQCPRCHRAVCVEHYPMHTHSPCLERLALHQHEYVCYVCGESVVPEQWSTAVFAHFIDNHACSGCGRYVCDTHSARRDEQVRIMQDGLRTHRYHLIHRSCELCLPLRLTGGIVGATWWAAGLATVLATGWFLFHG